MSFQAKILPFLLITLLSGLIYFNSLENGFHFDDTYHLIDNPYIRGLKYVPMIFTDTRTFSVWPGNNRHYRPLLLLTHVINYALGGLSPIGYHLVNLAFHVGSAFLVFLIVQAMSGVMGHGVLAALAAGLIFLVHPFNAEAVNYTTARSSLMSGFFYLLGFYCWVKFRSEKLGVGNQKRS